MKFDILLQVQILVFLLEGLDQLDVGYEKILFDKCNFFFFFVGLLEDIDVFNYYDSILLFRVQKFLGQE